MSDDFGVEWNVSAPMKAIIDTDVVSYTTNSVTFDDPKNATPQIETIPCKCPLGRALKSFTADGSSNNDLFFKFDCVKGLYTGFGVYNTDWIDPGSLIFGIGTMSINRLSAFDMWVSGNQIITGWGLKTRNVLGKVQISIQITSAFLKSDADITGDIAKAAAAQQAKEDADAKAKADLAKAIADEAAKKQASADAIKKLQNNCGDLADLVSNIIMCDPGSCLIYLKLNVDASTKGKCIWTYKCRASKNIDTKSISVAPPVWRNKSVYAKKLYNNHSSVWLPLIQCDSNTCMQGFEFQDNDSGKSFGVKTTCAVLNSNISWNFTTVPGIKAGDSDLFLQGFAKQTAFVTADKEYLNTVYGQTSGNYDVTTVVES